MWTKRLLKLYTVWLDLGCTSLSFLTGLESGPVLFPVWILLSVAGNVLLMATKTEVCFLFCRWGSSVGFADVLSSEKLILNATCWPTQVTALTPAHTATSPATVGATFTDTSAVPTPHCSPPTTWHILTTMFLGLLLPPLPRSTCSPDSKIEKATAAAPHPQVPRRKLTCRRRNDCDKTGCSLMRVRMGMVVVWVQCCRCRWCIVPTARGASPAWARNSDMNGTSSHTLARSPLPVRSAPSAVTAKVTSTVTFATTTMVSLTSRRLPLKALHVWLISLLPAFAIHLYIFVCESPESGSEHLHLEDNKLQSP